MSASFSTQDPHTAALNDDSSCINTAERKKQPPNLVDTRQNSDRWVTETRWDVESDSAVYCKRSCTQWCKVSLGDVCWFWLGRKPLNEANWAAVEMEWL